MSNLDIIVIAFNNLDIINLQYNFLKKYIINPFKYHIIDNSDNNDISNNIKNFCNINNIEYIKTNIQCTDCSKSHALALNFSLKNLNLQNEYILILDHDILPICYTNINNLINECEFYGLKQQRDNKWYLWPGLFLFKNNNIDKLDFSPVPGLDTGGKNWDNVFNNINNNKISIVKDFRYYSLNESINNIKNDIKPKKSINSNEFDYWHRNNDMFEYIDGWIHFINVSNWNKKGDKIHLIKEFCNLLIKSDNLLFTN